MMYSTTRRQQKGDKPCLLAARTMTPKRDKTQNDVDDNAKQLFSQPCAFISKWQIARFSHINPAPERNSTVSIQCGAMRTQRALISGLLL